TGANTSGNVFTNNPDRPSWNPSFSGQKILGKPTGWYDANAFILPAFGTYGNTPRGALIGPNFRELDLSIFKNTKLTEGISLQFRAESFNLLNHANFGIPNITPFSGTGISPTAGVITNTIGTSRQIQFGLKLIF